MALAERAGEARLSKMERRRRAPGLLALLREDLKTHNKDWTLPGFRALAAYRFARWALKGPPILRKPFVILGRMMLRRARNRYGIEIPVSAELGRRLTIAHQGDIVLHSFCTVGDDCTLRQGVTLGVKPSRPNAGPRLGDRVDVGAGAKIIGDVRIGDDVRIGANAVVTEDVPADHIVVAPASQMIHKPRHRR